MKENPITGQYNFKKEHFTIPKRLNMEPKKTINWARIWQIIQAIITMILATETATRSL